MYSKPTPPDPTQVGTETVIDVSLVEAAVAPQFSGWPELSSKKTMAFGPFVRAELKLIPLRVTEFPMMVGEGNTVLITGAACRITPLLATPKTCTTTGPVVAPEGI